jgi:hypothetical protein
MHPLVTPYQLMVAVLAVVEMIEAETAAIVAHVVVGQPVQNELVLSLIRRLSVSAALLV